MAWSSRGKWIAIVVVTLVAIRIALPPLVQIGVERVLARTPGYVANVRDVDLALWRGAYVIEGVTYDKIDKNERVPFLAIERIDLSVAWADLMEGELVSEIALWMPVVNFQRSPAAEETQTGEDVAWQDRVRELSPIRIDRFDVHAGFVHYRDTTFDPPLDVHLSDLDLEANDLSNTGGERLSRIVLAAKTSGGGELKASLELDPFAIPPRFDLDAALLDLDLTLLNDVFRALAGFDFEQGRADVFLELAANDGRVTGYVKPLLSDLDVLSWGGEEPGDDVIDLLWEGIVGASGEALQNQPEDQLAARIPLEGAIEDPAIGIWPLVLSLLRNGFVRALLPQVEGSVDLRRVDGVRFDS
jgi:hypothetical protein